MSKQKEENYNEAINRAASDTDPNERPASDTGVDSDGYVELKEEEPEGYVEPTAIHSNGDDIIQQTRQTATCHHNNNVNVIGCDIFVIL